MAIGQYPQHREEIGLPLHFVDYNETAQRAQRSHRLRKTPLADRVFEIEKLGLAVRADFPCGSGLASLPRPIERRHGIGPDAFSNAVEKCDALDIQM
jgi:hypothetical protein